MRNGIGADQFSKKVNEFLVSNNRGVTPPPSFCSLAQLKSHNSYNLINIHNKQHLITTDSYEIQHEVGVKSVAPPPTASTTMAYGVAVCSS